MGHMFQYTSIMPKKVVKILLAMKPDGLVTL